MGLGGAEGRRVAKGCRWVLKVSRSVALRALNPAKWLIRLAPCGVSYPSTDAGRRLEGAKALTTRDVR